MDIKWKAKCTPLVLAQSVKHPHLVKRDDDYRPLLYRSSVLMCIPTQPHIQKDKANTTYAPSADVLRHWGITNKLELQIKITNLFILTNLVQRVHPKWNHYGSIVIKIN